MKFVDKMKNALIFISLLLPYLHSAQNDCNCASELEFIIEYYETNLPGFKDNVYEATQSEYDNLKKTVREEATKVGLPSDCYKVLIYYVEFFKDNHSTLRMRIGSLDETNQSLVDSFYQTDQYKSREMVDLKNVDLTQFKGDDIQGVYQTKDGTYKVAVIENKGALRDYVGVILESKSKLWKPGHVKFELKQKKDGKIDAFSYMRNHSLRYTANYFHGYGMLGNAWYKTNSLDKVNHALNTGNKIDFKVIQDSIAYMYIPTFSGGYSAALDSFYKANKKTIESTPYLIIDVRNNGGGNDNNVTPLLDYIYTNPISGDNVDLYVTEANTAVWRKWTEDAKKDTKNFNKFQIKWFEKELRAIEKATPGTFISRSKGRTFKRKLNPNRPKKVAVLFNRNCASSCESLLFLARESSNTIMVGENSGGYVGYGENGSVKTPCYQFTLTCTMTRYEKQRAYEVVGVPPKFRLDYEKDWIEQTIKLLTES